MSDEQRYVLDPDVRRYYESRIAELERQLAEAVNEIKVLIAPAEVGGGREAYLSGEVERLRRRYMELACAAWGCPLEEFQSDGHDTDDGHAATLAEVHKDVRDAHEYRRAPQGTEGYG